MFGNGALLDGVSREVDAFAGDRQAVSRFRRALERDAKRPGCENAADASPLLSLVRDRELAALAAILEGRGHVCAVLGGSLFVFLRSERAAERVRDGVLRHLARRSGIDAGGMIEVCAPGSLVMGNFAVLPQADGASVTIAEPARKALRSELRRMTSRSSGEGYRHRARRMSACMQRWGDSIALCDDADSLSSELDEWLAMRLNALYVHENARVRSRVSLYKRWGLRAGSADALARSRAGAWAVSCGARASLPGMELHRCSGFPVFSEIVSTGRGC